MDKGSVETGTQDHIHVHGDKGRQWSQNQDGSPHDKNKNSSGSPPNSIKKKLKEDGWDWDEKAKQYNDSNYQKSALYYDEVTEKYFVVNNGETYYLSEFEVNMYFRMPSGQPIPEAGQAPRGRFVVPRLIFP